MTSDHNTNSDSSAATNNLNMSLNVKQTDTTLLLANTPSRDTVESVGYGHTLDSIQIISSKRSVLSQPKKSAATILLVGETGTGKTTFMSLLVNLFQGRTTFELRDAHNDNSESGLNKVHSQTTSASLYTVVTSDGFKLNIIDTPGLADTRGMDHDSRHRAEINRAIKEFAPFVDAILIMANGTIERLPAATAYTLDIIATIFPHSIVDNIGLMLTNSNPLTSNFQMESLPISLRLCENWVIQNPLALVKKFQSDTSVLASHRKSKAQKEVLDRNYQETIHTLNDWLDWLDERLPKSTNEVNDLYGKSTQIDSKIKAALASFASLAKSRQEWERISLEVLLTESNKGDIEDKIRKQKEKVTWVLQGSENENWVCEHEHCHSNCPDIITGGTAATMLGGAVASMCGSAFAGVTAGLTTISVVGTAGFAGIVGLAGFGSLALMRAPCNVCKHSLSSHQFRKSAWILQPGGVDRETMDKLAAAQTKEEKEKAIQQIVRRELDAIQAETSDIQATLRSLIIQYNQISLNDSFAGHIRSAIQVLQLRENELKSKGDSNSSTNLELIRESIAVLKEKLKLLTVAVDGSC